MLTGNPAARARARSQGERARTRIQRPDRMPSAAVRHRREALPDKREPGALPKFDEAAARARPGAQMFANRLRKNFNGARHVGARREAIACFRVYDADMPEYAFAIDLYQYDAAGARSTALALRAGVRSRPRRSTAKARGAARGSVRRDSARCSASARERDVLRARRQQKGGSQYEKLADARRVPRGDRGRAEVPRELHGLPRHRPVPRPPAHTRADRRAAKRQALPEPVRYTGTASVFAAAGGAASHHEHRHVAHLSRLGAAQSRAQWFSRLE